MDQYDALRLRGARRHCNFAALNMERSRTELALFGVGAACVWFFVAGVILVSKWLCLAAVLGLLFCVGCFALRNGE